MSRGRLRLAPDEAEQGLRLLAFRKAHADVVIAEAGFGTWEGRVPEPAGETVVVRYSLKDLLDKLDELCAQDGP